MASLRVLVAITVLGLGAALMAAPLPDTDTLTGINQINEDGFGTRANKYAFSIATFNDALYVGTLNIRRMPGMFRFFTGTSARRATDGAQIWRYDKDGTWTKVVDAGLENPHNLGVRKLAVAKGCLYGVTANHDEGMEVWRVCDGATWEVVAKRGFGEKNNTSGRGLGEFKGHIYVGTENRRSGAQLWRSADGEKWIQVADKGISDRRNWWVSDFVEFQDRLYMGTLNARGMQLYRTHDGRHFKRLFKGGLDKSTNTAAMKLYVFNNKLFVSTMDYTKGFDLYMSEDGINFERVIKKGFNNRHYAYLWQLEEYNGKLYAGTYHHGGFMNLPRGTFSLLSSDDGIEWKVENDNAFGNPWYYGIRTTAVFDDKLILGTASARYGCKIIEAKGK